MFGRHVGVNALPSGRRRMAGGGKLTLGFRDISRLQPASALLKHAFQFDHGMLSAQQSFVHCANAALQDSRCRYLLTRRSITSYMSTDWAASFNPAGCTAIPICKGAPIRAQQLVCQTSRTYGSAAPSMSTFFQQWSDRKSQFTRRQIAIALERLVDAGWINPGQPAHH